ncbi:MAG: hypothetical protein K0S07_1518 [Chlamydiales bacterium]|jgi:L-threonylcarbamoyladenylate synthase|nr:hypothetical protein [Chlamydiales bacterium]
MNLSLEEAGDRLLGGQVVAIPTETVYGLAASIACPDAIRQIFALKNRPADNPLIVHAADLRQVQALTAAFPPEAQALADCFWPGPLTLILPAKEGAIAKVALAGQTTVAIRIPAHPLTRTLIQRTGPLVAPSANLSGRPSATLPEHIRQDFGQDFPLLAAGPCALGVESTILSYQGDGWQAARLGAISLEDIEKALKRPLTPPTAQIICPGQRYRHYAPSAALTLGSTYPGTPPCVIGFLEREYPQAQRLLPLGSLSNPQECLSNLYATLRHLDALSIPAAWVDCNFPSDGLFQTLHERLKKAASS